MRPGSCSSWGAELTPRRTQSQGRSLPVVWSSTAGIPWHIPWAPHFPLRADTARLSSTACTARPLPCHGCGSCWHPLPEGPGPCWHPLPEVARAARMEHQGLGENRTAGRRKQEPQQRLVLSFLLMTLPDPQGEHSCPEKRCLSLPASFLSSSSEKHCEKKGKK